MSVGTNTYIDLLLAEYQPDEVSQQGIVGELFEDETNALLYAVLKELRGERAAATSGSGPGKNNVTYTVKEETVDNTEPDKIEWNWPANTVLVYGFDAAINIAFQKDENIPLAAEYDPFTLGPDNGLGATELWYSKQSGAADTSITVVPFE